MYSVVIPAAGIPKVITGGSPASRWHRAAKSFSEAIRARNSGLGVPGVRGVTGDDSEQLGVLP